MPLFSDAIHISPPEHREVWLKPIPRTYVPESREALFAMCVKVLVVCERSLSYLLLLSLCCPCHRLPAPGSSMAQVPGRHADSQQLTITPGGAEITGFLLRNTHKRLVLAVEERDGPVTVTVRVVPCDAPLQWNLTLWEPEEVPSQDASGGFHPQETRLFSYRGNDVETFSRVGKSVGRYTLELLCTERDTGVRVWAGTGPKRPYPTLPRDPLLEVATVGRTSLSLVWKPSPDIATQYCALVNRRHNYKSLCAAETELWRWQGITAEPWPTQAHGFLKPPVIRATGRQRVVELSPWQLSSLSLRQPSPKMTSSSSPSQPVAWRQSSSPWKPDVWQPPSSPWKPSSSPWKPSSMTPWQPVPWQPSPRLPHSSSFGQLEPWGPSISPSRKPFPWQLSTLPPWQPSSRGLVVGGLPPGRGEWGGDGNAEEREVDALCLCTGSTNSLTVSRLRPGTQYYLDVFAVNPVTGASTAYGGTFTRTRPKAEGLSMEELKRGKVTELKLKGGGLRLLRFRPSSSQRPRQRLVLSVWPCRGPVHVWVRQEGGGGARSLVSRWVRGLEHLYLSRGKPGAYYLIQLQARPEASASLRLHATDRPDKLPFPPLPRDTRLRVFSRLRGCSELTLAWLSSPHSAGSRYCVYRRVVHPPGGPGKPPDSCLHPSSRPRTEKVGCQTSRGSVTTQRVEGLRPGTTYLLDVYVSGPGQEPVSYQGKVVSTRRAC